MRQSHSSVLSAARLAPFVRCALRFVPSITAIVLMIGLPTVAQHDVHAQLIAKAMRKNAPQFHLRSADGKIVQLSDFKGKVVLVNFWATNCGGCVLEIPSFIELQRKYGDKSFTVVGISADIPYGGLKGPEEAWQKVRPFVAQHHINYPIVMGDDAVIDAFGFKAYPATFLIDKSGLIAASYVGVVSKDDVSSNISKLLAEH
ncbi:MAG TPA: TlpA disulfide reductase family protein [Candidatus Acidoferrales bacterium]|nr:TlpA disulfide reductase family protein [Candidatus Acidoferrales bacterium]